jgi:hypothetical protein
MNSIDIKMHGTTIKSNIGKYTDFLTVPYVILSAILVAREIRTDRQFEVINVYKYVQA